MDNKFIPGVRLHAFQRLFPSSLSGLSYILPETRTTGIDVWAQGNVLGGPSVTTLEVKSGGGKSTLANCLMGFLESPFSASPCFSWVGVPDLDYEVSMVPQQPHVTMHWRVSDMIRPASRVLATVFPDESPDKLYSMHLS